MSCHVPATLSRSLFTASQLSSVARTVHSTAATAVTTAGTTSCVFRMIVPRLENAYPKVIRYVEPMISPIRVKRVPIRGKAGFSESMPPPNQGWKPSRSLLQEKESMNGRRAQRAARVIVLALAVLVRSQ